VGRVEEKLRLLKPLISLSSISIERRAPTRLVLRGTIVFIDGSKLTFLEYIVSEEEKLERISYRFHYTDRDNNLIFRYDNAPHHKELSSYPHHKHLADGRVIEAYPISLLEVLDEISMLLLKWKAR